MVNTFLVYPDFRRSARALDYRRLGKQRVEAYQILNLIQDLKYISSQLNIPCCLETKEDRKQWVRTVVRTYRNCPIRYVRRDDDLYASYNIHDVQTPSGRKITLGPHVYHPIIHSWFHYEDALKLYINCHIEEWKRRGYKNNMATYIVDENCPKPDWIYDNNLHENHRSNLMTKERDRKEKPWYIHMDDFKDQGVFESYIWPIA